VGLLNALHALQGHMVSKAQLARESIHIEQDVLKETVGCQDQVLAAHGGVNCISFHQTEDITVRPLTLTRERIDEVNSHLMLFFTGIVRTASGVAQTYVPGLREKSTQLHRMAEMVEEGAAILHEGRPLAEFGHLLNEGWRLKRALANGISNPEVEHMYEEAVRGGAYGGKLTGAGGGGFLLLFAPPEAHEPIRERLRNLIYVPLRIEFSGSHIIFFEPEEDFAPIERNRSLTPVQAFREMRPLWEGADTTAVHG
jgi:D-glycero-alpha-D-manno-heptose-7-phosphate kinase